MDENGTGTSGGDTWSAEDYIFNIDITVEDDSDDDEALVQYLMAADLEENAKENQQPENDVTTDTGISCCGVDGDADVQVTAGSSGVRQEVGRSWRKSAISATAEAVATKFNNLRRCIQTSFATPQLDQGGGGPDEQRTQERRLRLEEVKFYLEWFVASYGTALQLGRYQPGSSPELFVTHSATTTGDGSGTVTLSGEINFHLPAEELATPAAEMSMTPAPPQHSFLHSTLANRRVASEGDLNMGVGEFGDPMAAAEGTNPIGANPATGRSSLTAPNNLSLLRNPRIAAAAAATVAAVNASRYRGGGAAGNNRDREEQPRPLAPPDEILRELADIRRLLLQRLVLQGGANGGPAGDPTLPQLDMDPDDELLELLEALAEEGGVAAGLGASGPGGEPLPHFPVGPWAWLECQVCLEPRWLYRRACCSLPACGDCLRHYLGVRVSEGSVRIPCPNPKCTDYVTRDEISARLEGSLKTKFHQFLVEANADPRVKTCPRCNHITTRGATAATQPEVKRKGVSLVPEVDMVAYNAGNVSTTNPTEVARGRRSRKSKSLDRIRVVCTECSLVWCFACHSPWHEGLTCRQFRKGDRLLKTWAHEVHHGQLNAQKCPKCNVFIQRTTGCDHMHCTRCKTDFCYRCGDQLRKLRFFGDHYSKLSVFGCKFRYKADKPVQRKLIRGAVFGGKLMVAPVLGTLGACAGIFALGFGIFILPVYGGVRLYQKFGARRQHVHRFEFPQPTVLRFGNEPSVLEGHHEVMHNRRRLVM